MDKAPSGLDAALQTDDVLLMIERDYAGKRVAAALSSAQPQQKGKRAALFRRKRKGVGAGAKKTVQDMKED